jgi:hypothetical protein
MIKLIYGNRQQFRFRHNDINILGYVDVQLPLKRSVYSLNNGLPKHFYVEPKLKPEKCLYPWGTKTPSVHRLRNRPGNFNIEIPINSSELWEGWNDIKIQVENAQKKTHILNAKFHWNSQPLSLPLQITDLSAYQNIQEIGQVVNGAFDIDSEKNVIRSRKPVGSDILLLLGSPHTSQEATYDVKFTHQEERWCFVGLSDFFAEHSEQSSELGIKPGYSTAGLATIDNGGRAQIWIAWGDCLYDKENTWVIKTEKKIKTPIRSGVTYSVRHQVIIEEGINCGRFRIWKKGKPEPQVWLCQEHNTHLPPHFPRITKASFGLFQYWGLPTEWSNIYVKPLNIDIRTLHLTKEKNYLIELGRNIREVTNQFLQFIT